MSDSLSLRLDSITPVTSAARMDDSILVDVATLGNRTFLKVSRRKQSFWALMFLAFPV